MLGGADQAVMDVFERQVALFPPASPSSQTLPLLLAVSVPAGNLGEQHLVPGVSPSALTDAGLREPEARAGVCSGSTAADGVPMLEPVWKLAGTSMTEEASWLRLPTHFFNVPNF